MPKTNPDIEREDNEGGGQPQGHIPAGAISADDSPQTQTFKRGRVGTEEHGRPPQNVPGDNQGR